MNTTPAKFAANRENARKSTGPRTPEGKARTKRNALKHGLLAGEAILAQSDGPRRCEQFRALLADLIAEFDPQTRLDRVLVERVAVCFWRLRRAQHSEITALNDVLDQRPEDPAETEVAELEYELQQTRQARKLDAENLQFLRDLDVSDPDALERAAPVFNRMRLRYSRDVFQLPDHHLREVLLDELP